MWYFDRKLLGRQKLETLYRNAKALNLAILQMQELWSSTTSRVTKTAKHNRATDRIRLSKTNKNTDVKGEKRPRDHCPDFSNLAGKKLH